jgi:hypothetical protein
MALANRAKETSTTTGTGTYSLDGAVTGYKTLVAAATADIGGSGPWTVSYVAAMGTEYEYGIGTLTDASPDTLARTTVVGSSNGGAAVNWTTGTKNIVISPLASDFGKSSVLTEKSANYTIVAADLAGFSEVVIPFSISAASCTCQLPTVANLNGKLVRVQISTGPASDTSSNKLTVYQSDGSTELFTGYAKGDFVLVTSDGTNYRILDELTTVVGRLALSVDEAFSTGTTTKIFDANYTEVRDIGAWWNSATNHRLNAAFACDVEVFLSLLEITAAYLEPIVRVNGTAIFNSEPAHGYGVGRGLPLLVKLAAGDYLEMYVRNDSGVNGTIMGDAALNETQLFWRVIRRIR